MRTAKLTTFLARLGLLISRGNNFVFGFGGLYVRTPEADDEINRILLSQLPAAPTGQVFMRQRTWRKKTSAIAVLITGVGRLGNSIIQTLNAATLARLLGANGVYYHRFDAIENRVLELGPNLEMRKLSLLGPTGKKKPDIIWRTYALASESPLDFPCSPESTLARESLRVGLFGTDTEKISRSNKSLTIYLRSGDVFADNPETHYGQPPWAFYEKVLEYREWSAVELVAEDHGNPNHGLILKWCEQKGLKVTERGETLSDAIDAVVNSSNLVSARGTFVPSLVFLSEGPKNIFQFHDRANPLTCRKGLTILRVTDKSGEYISSVMSRNWVNSEAQRKLMVTYPIDSLSAVSKDKP